MPLKDFNRVLDELLATRGIRGDPGLLDLMNQEQRHCINEVKKSLKRIWQ